MGFLNPGFFLGGGLPSPPAQKYKVNYPHIAPELYKQNLQKSIQSDVYSFGWMLRCLKHCLRKKDMKSIFEKCLHSCPSQRPVCVSAVKEMLISSQMANILATILYVIL
jgi:serine/threonine protein kinase